ncbi:MAG: threonine ammonia-lyase IlvA [bacterium]|nr:threonine ammonia-lyase IlvA [bacterium]
MVTLKMIDEAAVILNGVAQKTILQYCKRLSLQYKANVYLKREDLQEVRSYKIRGAYNKMISLSSEEKKRGVVCASAGNHAQGVAYSCSALKIKGVIFMPIITPNQKIEKVKHFGDGYVDIKLIGNDFEEASNASKKFCKEKGAAYVHPFDDPYTISGQGTVGKEIYEELNGKIDYVFVVIGGGGLISGISIYIKGKNKKIKIIGAEPNGAAGMYHSLQNNRVITLESLDNFVDGCAVKTVGNLTFNICKKNVDKIVKMPEGQVCTVMIDLYQNEGIIAEPAGAVSVAALDNMKDMIKGKTVVCVISGGNNDILRYPDVMERSLVYQGRKHYFLIEFAQKPGQLKNFLNHALGPHDDIVLFEYIKKTNKEKGPALVGVELRNKKDLESLLKKMTSIELKFTVIKDKELLYGYLI